MGVIVGIVFWKGIFWKFGVKSVCWGKRNVFIVVKCNIVWF